MSSADRFKPICGKTVGRRSGSKGRRIVRTRLKESFERMEETPACGASNSGTTLLNVTRTQTVKTYPRRIPRQTFSADRFISRRCECNVDAANYILTKQAGRSLRENELDVFKQLASLGDKWRKKSMHQLMVKENAIPGLRQKQVLRSSQLSLENKLPGNLAGQSKDLWDEEYFEDGIWKSKPRKRPLIGTMDSILDMPGLGRSRYYYHQFDWSSTNFMAAAVQDTVTFFDARAHQPLKMTPLLNVIVCALKWSNAGNKLAICQVPSSVSLYDMDVEKIVWNSTCGHRSECITRSVCWSYNDLYIVTGCRGIITVYSASTGDRISNILVQSTDILTLSFSSNYGYLVSTTSDMTIHIFLWPNLQCLLDITYFAAIKAVAWHPNDSALLCVGGGFGDASLSLWNVNKLEPTSYRRVNFNGAVESLAWNKISGELVVHWSIWKDGARHTIMPVLASLDRIVDEFPVKVDLRHGPIKWSPDHTQIATQSGESLSIWNFFGNEHQYRIKHRKPVKEIKMEKDAMPRKFEEFKKFNIR